MKLGGEAETSETAQVQSGCSAGPGGLLAPLALLGLLLPFARVRRRR